MSYCIEVNTPQADGVKASRILINTVLQKAAKSHNMTMEQLKALPGKSRRSHHDDITCTVIYF